MQRIIFHVDMDAFFAAIEQRDNPKLRGKPVIVGGAGKRGVVATASYEARVFGVGSAMPSIKAKERCPHGIFVSPRMSVYGQISKQIMQVFGHFSPLVEPLSIDEAFLDLSGTEKLFGPPQKTAKRLQEEVFKATGLTCSVGIAENKFLAKLCSEMNKPKGITNFLFSNIPKKLSPLLLNKLWGVGPKTLAKLHALNLKTFGDIQRSDEETMLEHFGVHGQKLFHLAYGRDEREVTPGEQQKSIGSEMTFSEDIQGTKEVTKYIRKQCN
jgi:DNA polymerase-4